MSGGGSFSSDQTTSLLDTIGANTLSRLGRARITSIQGKGIDSSVLLLYDNISSAEMATSAIKLVSTFKYSDEGLSVYIPGSGILFKRGICFNLAGASGSVTITITGG